MNKAKLSIRTGSNLDHHLYDNNGTIYVNYTIHCGAQKERIRTSLHTRDLEVARQRRDALLARVAATGEVDARAGWNTACDQGLDLMVSPDCRFAEPTTDGDQDWAA